MIKLRLLKQVTPKVYTLLEQYDLGSLPEKNAIEFLMKGVSKVLGKYQELLNDPNIVTALDNQSIDDWTVGDLMSINGTLSITGLRLLITDENQDEVGNVSEKSVMYLGINNSYKSSNVIPEGAWVIKPYSPNMDVLSAYRSILPETFFNRDKFYNNPIDAYIKALESGRNITGTYDLRTMSKLINLLEIMQFEIITVLIEE